MMSGSDTAGLVGQCNADGLTGMINRITTALEELQRRFSEAMAEVDRVIQNLARLTGGQLPWLGAVRTCCALAGAQVTMFVENVQSAIRHLSAPWFIKCIGEKIRDGMLPRVTAFAGALDPDSLTCAKTWEGGAAERFFRNADKQKAAGDATQSAIRLMADRLERMGRFGIGATIAFLFGITIAATKFALAVQKLPSVPLGTVAGLALMVAAAAEALAIIAAFVMLVNGAAFMAEEVADAVADVPITGGKWPTPRL